MFSRRTPRQNRGRVGGFGISFKPTQLPGLVLWLRADKGISIGTGVSAWADQSGNGHNFTQGTGASQPAYGTIGGKPYLTATGTQGLTCIHTMSAIMGAATAGERFYVAKLSADATTQQSGANWGTGDGSSYFEFSDSHVYDGFCASARQTGNAVTAGMQTSPFVQDVQSANSAFSILINGATNFTTATNTFSPGTTAPSVFCAGVNGSISVSIGECVVFSRVLSSAERAQMRAYFTSFWGTP